MCPYCVKIRQFCVWMCQLKLPPLKPSVVWVPTNGSKLKTQTNKHKHMCYKQAHSHINNVLILLQCTANVLVSVCYIWQGQEDMTGISHDMQSVCLSLCVRMYECVCVSERSGNHLIGFLNKGRRLYIYSEGEPVGFGAVITPDTKWSGPGVQNHSHHSSLSLPALAPGRCWQHNKNGWKHICYFCPKSHNTMHW